MPVPNRTIFLHKCSIAVPFVTGRLLAAATAVNGTSRNFIMIRASEHTVAFFWVKASLVSKASVHLLFLTVFKCLFCKVSQSLNIFLTVKVLMGTFNKAVVCVLCDCYALFNAGTGGVVACKQILKTN